jgi:hypothetical protein
MGTHFVSFVVALAQALFTKADSWPHFSQKQTLGLGSLQDMKGIYKPSEGL